MNEIENFKKLINEKEFYAAHEALEELWFPIRKSKSEYCLSLKGFINAAVSLELYKRKKIEQSRKIYLIYKKYVSEERISQTENYSEFMQLKLFIDMKFSEINMKIIN